MLALVAMYLPTSFAEEVTYTCLDDNLDGVVLVDGAGNGECMTIQEAIDTVEAGSVIEIADGTYQENLVIDNKILTIQSQSGDPEDVIIDANSADRGIYVSNMEGSGTVKLNGLTVENGYSTAGAGMYVYNGAVLVENCIFENNDSSGSGGGVYLYGLTDDVVIERSIFRFNNSRHGGGLYIYESGTYDVIIKNNIFNNNEIDSDGGAIFCGPSVAPGIYNNTFVSNEAGENGGAIYLYTLSDDTAVQNNIFFDNTSDPTGQTDGEGDAIYLKGNLDRFPFDYNLFYDNNVVDFWAKTKSKTISQIGEGNIDFIHGFTDVENDDFTLAEGSACINAGMDLSAAGVTEDFLGESRPLGSSYDIGAYEYVEEEVTEEETTEEETTEEDTTEEEIDYQGYCEENDGTFDSRDDDDYCVFEDESYCQADVFYAGFCEAGENAPESEYDIITCGDFPDVDPSLYTDEECVAIEWSQNEEIFTGNDDTGNLESESPINRAETTKVLIESFGYSPNDGMESMFSDVLAGTWYLEYVNAAADLGIVEGYPDGTFRPADTVNKVEMLKIVLETAGVDLSKVDISEELFTDIAIDESTEWFRPYAYYAYQNGLVDIDGDEFEPNADILRRDVILVLYRLDLLLGS